MEKKIALGLIKLDVLNNIDAQDAEALQYLKRNDDDFPWKELGDYQNLVALLALTSKLEEPDPDLKNKIFARLYSYKKVDKQDEIFETNESDNLNSIIPAGETTQKFKIETNGEKANFNQGPIVEFEEFELGSSFKTEQVTDNIATRNDLNERNISGINKTEPEPVQEKLYEIEEYDLEMAHEDHIEENELKVELTPVIYPEPDNALTNSYEIEEFDAAETENNLVAHVQLHDQTADEPIENDIIVQTPDQHATVKSEDNTQLADEHSELEKETIIQFSDDKIEAEEKIIENDEDIIIYDSNESVDQIASEILGNVEVSTKEIVSEIKPPDTIKINEKEITKPASEKNHTIKPDNTGDSISFREPNLSQLHILFKDSQDVMAKEKEIRQEYRAKISKEKTEISVSPVENKINVENIAAEIKPIVEVSKTEPETITQNDNTEVIENPVDDLIEAKTKSPHKLKKEKDSKSNKKVIFIAAAILIVCASVLFFMQSPNETKGEQIKIAKSEQNPETYENVVEEKKPEGLIIVEDIQQVKQKNIPTTQPDNKIPAPPQKPQMIEPEVITESVNTQPIKIANNETQKKEVVQAPPKQENKIEEETTYFVAVEEMPSPIGGLSGIQSKIVYPKVAELAGVQGKVLVLAYVNETGNVTKVELVKGIGAGCDEVALDAVRQTKFKPGLQRGKPVKVRVTIPIVFKKQ